MHQSQRRVRCKGGSFWKCPNPTTQPPSSPLPSKKTRNSKTPKSDQRYRLLSGTHTPEEVPGIQALCESEKDVGMQDRR